MRSARPILGEAAGASGALLSLRALSAHRFLLRASLAAANIFAWVFVFESMRSTYPLPEAFARVVLLYALAQVLIALMTPLAAQFLRHGARRALSFGALLLALAFALLAGSLSDYMGIDASVGFVWFAVLLGSYRAMYWVPYETELEHQGVLREGTWRAVVLALIPLVAGLYLASAAGSRLALLYAASLLAALSIFPLSGVRDAYENFSWSYRETFAECMAPEHRLLVRRALIEGALGAALLMLWPLSVFLIMNGSYGMLGIILSATFLTGIAGRSLVRGVIRKLDLHTSAPVNALLLASPWLLRLGVGSPLGVVLVDSYFYTTSPNRSGVDAVVFEQAGDAGYFLDEYTALKEVALAFGRIGMCLLAAALVYTISLPVALIGCFALAALLSALLAAGRGR